MMMHPGPPSSGSLPPPPGAVPAPAPVPSSSLQGPPESTQVSSLPLPPLQYIKAYTDENMSRGLAPPPPPPILHEAYLMFGAPFPPMSSSAGSENDIVQSLESQGFRRLYSAKDVDRKKELKKLNHSLLVNFLDLLDILIKCPDTPRRDEKIEDINLLFINMHHLINEFRPHQARETLRVMLHVQKRKRLQVAEKFQGHLDKIQISIREALEALPDVVEDSKEGILLLQNSVENSKEGIAGSGGENSGDAVSEENRRMCQLVDQMMEEASAAAAGS